MIEPMSKDTRTDVELNRIIADWFYGGELYHIVKRGYFYRPGAAGYTDRESEAWRVPLDVAKKHEYLRGEEPVRINKAKPPAYCSDLNLVNEAEGKLFPVHVHELNGPDRVSMYRQALEAICVGHPGGPVRSSARQRSEALVYVIESKRK